MKFRLLDIVAPERDLPEAGLRRGDSGTVVEVYEPNGLEVEFMDDEGDTVAVLTLSTGDVRPTRDPHAVPVPAPSP